MATIKAIEGRSVHQIQSGQVIVDLCSVVKELIENSLDAGATSVDVRFKNNGLDSIEVQDNGAGISPEDYETIALKHYTSKLSNYDDLGTLDTFGFRGEALSSLCALSRFHIITARDGEAPKGKRLDFETSGKLKSTAIAACQKGTTVAVEDLFHNLPVRRHELEKNVKREYAKVLGILHAYACISTGVRFGVSNQMPKGKKMVLFSTKANPTTKDNIANVFGAKTLPAIIPLELELELQATTSQALTEFHTQNGNSSRVVRVAGHISRPVYGEGRQTPDRQMFFVNSRPCGLPQISKAFNEVYKSFNVTQSPFIFANLLMDTNAYDVNVSPDKRTILLHDQTVLLETLKAELMKMFEAQEQTIPQSQLTIKKLPIFRPLTLTRETSEDTGKAIPSMQDDGSQRPAVLLWSGLTSTSSNQEDLTSSECGPLDLMSRFVARNHERRSEVTRGKSVPKVFDSNETPEDRIKLPGEVTSPDLDIPALEESQRHPTFQNSSGVDTEHSPPPELPRAVQDFNARIASQQAKSVQGKIHGQNRAIVEEEIASLSPSPNEISTDVVQAAYDRARPKRTIAETATITIGDKISTAIIGNSSPFAKRRRVEPASSNAVNSLRKEPSKFAQKLRAFAGPGSQLPADDNDDIERSSDVEGRHVEDCSKSHELSSVSVDAAMSEDDSPGDRNPIHDSSGDSDGDDDDYVDEAEKKKLEEARVQQLIEDAEAAAAHPTQANIKRAVSLLRSQLHKESTLNLVRFVDISCARIREQHMQLAARLKGHAQRSDDAQNITSNPITSNTSPEERLSLTITRADFAEMRVVGQFNLGFILATRSSRSESPSFPPTTTTPHSDDLFIIDQHASDEIYNFMRLSKSTTLTPQPLVRPHPLDLTAIEEEIILSHTDTLTKNGFTIAFDGSGAAPVGRRCNLSTLPTSRETVFDTRDLEELISLLAEATPAAGEVVRPSRVRRMLAMRACRSSIMVGKTLNEKGMREVVRHMGEIERPWNCPHGRPTMRHLAGLGEWEGWAEGGGLAEDDGADAGVATDWKAFVEGIRERGLLDAEAVVDDDVEMEEEDGGEVGTVEQEMEEEENNEAEGDADSAQESTSEGGDEDGDDRSRHKEQADA